MQQQVDGGGTFEVSLPKPVFQLRRTTLSSGLISGWRINFERLDDSSVWCFAAQIAQQIGEFGRVEGVPTGGDRLAECLSRWLQPNSDRLLIVDDVLTTGESIRRKRNGRLAVGWVVFDRSAEFSATRPQWVHALWRYEGRE